MTGTFPAVIRNGGDGAIMAVKRLLAAQPERNEKRAIYDRRLHRFYEWCGWRSHELSDLEKRHMVEYELYLRARFKDDEARFCFQAVQQLLDRMVKSKVIDVNPAVPPEGKRFFERKSMVMIDGFSIPGSMLSTWGDLPGAITKMEQGAVEQLARFVANRKLSTQLHIGLSLLPFCSWCSWNGYALEHLDGSLASRFTRLTSRHYYEREARRRIATIRDLYDWYLDAELVSGNPFRGFIRKRKDPRQLLVPLPILSQPSSIPNTVRTMGHEISTAYCEFVATRSGSNQRSTAGRCLRHFYDWCASAHISFGEVATETVSRFLKSISSKRSNSVVQAHALYLRQFYDHLLKRDKAQFNPVPRSIVPKANTYHFDGPIPTPDEIQKLKLASMKAGTITGMRDRAIISIVYNAMIKSPEVAALNVDDFYFEDGAWRLRIDSGSGSRVIPVNSALTEDLTEYLAGARIGDESGKPLFRQSITGSPDKLSLKRVTVDAVRERFVASRQLAKLPDFVNSISVRRAGIRGFLKSGGSIQQAAYITGLSVGTIGRYREPNESVVLYEGDMEGLVSLLEESSTGSLQRFVKRSGIFRLSVLNDDGSEAEEV